MPLEERLGKEKAKLSIEKNRKTKIKNGMILTKDFLIEKAQEKFKQYGEFFKSDIDKIMPFNQQTIRNKFGGLDEFAEIANIKFKPSPTNRLGKNEKFILDNIEVENDIKLERQFSVKIDDGTRYYGDGYDKVNNVWHEVYEKNHYLSKQIIKDEKRMVNIRSLLGCVVIIHDEQSELNRMTHTSLSSFL